MFRYLNEALNRALEVEGATCQRRRQAERPSPQKHHVTHEELSVVSKRTEEEPEPKAVLRHAREMCCGLLTMKI